MESQPRTPGDALTTYDTDDSPNKSNPEVQYDEDGFKVPGEPKSPTKPSSQEEMVARRTRSKVSLTTTPIETIQDKFAHPDICPGTYEPVPEMDVDEPWQEFLHQFQQPLDDKGDEEEDNNDPEYVARATTVTSENDTHIKITKKEVQVLIDELLEGFEESFNPDFPNDLEIDALKASFSLPSTSSAAVLNPPEHIQMQEQEIFQQSIVDMNVSANLYHSGQVNEFPVATEQVEPFIEPLAILNAAPTFSKDLNMILGSDNKLYLVPRSAVTGVEEVEEEGQEVPEEEIPSDVDSDLCIGGWTKESVRQFQRQLLSHVQLLGQCFTQTYSHPEVWQMARDFKQMLDGVMEVAKKETQRFVSVLCWNLVDMVKICKKWQLELDEITEENEEYVRDLQEFDDGMVQYSRFFPPRLAELWVTNRAFMFQEFLPSRVVNAYRGGGSSQGNFTKGETKLLALAVIKGGHHKRKVTKWREETAHYYQKRYNNVRPMPYLKQLLVNLLWNKRPNAVKLAKNEGQAPEIIHEALAWGSYDEVVLHADKEKFVLPIRWNKYVHNVDRVSKKLGYVL